LADRLISHPVRVAEDVFIKVGTFHFPTDFIVIDFDADPRVPLILERSFLKIERALIDMFKVNYNQGNTSYLPPMMSNKIRPPGFPPLTKLLLISAPQTQGVSKEDFPAYVKANDAVMRNMQTHGQNMQNQLTNLTDLLTKFMNYKNASTSSSGTLPSNTIANPRSDLNAITTRSGASYDGPQILPSPSILPKVVENEPEATKDTVHPTNNESTKDVQPSVVQTETPEIQISKPVIEPVSSPFGPSIKSLLTNKDKLCELARTPLNEHCSAVLLKKLPEKLEDPENFLILCDFPGKAECLALAYLGASINLMPLFVWNKLSLPDLTPLCMTLELTDRSISHPVGVVEDVYIGRALIDVFEGELTLCVGKESITFNLDQTLRYSANYNDMTAKRIDVIDMACEEYSQEVPGFSDIIASGNPTPYYDLIVSTTSSTLTPFGNSDFLLEEVDAFLALEDDPSSLEVNQSYLDSERDILLLEAFLNDDPSLPPPNQGNYLPEGRKELKICEAKSDKSSIDEPLEVELKDLPPHLEYVFLEGDDKFPIIITKDLSVEEKTALITVLKSHKRAITWKLSDIKGIDPEFCTHKILIEEDFELAVQHQRRVNPKIHDVIKKEVLKLLDAGLIYLISDSPWRCMMAIFHDMIEKTMEVFMDDFSVFGNYFQSCLSHFEKILKRYEDTNLCLNWEKSNFMVKKGIVLSHKISKKGIEVDKAKVDFITKLPHQTTVK
nr:hypothetical protein [Tanacetum cinerariifolium]